MTIDSKYGFRRHNAYLAHRKMTDPDTKLAQGVQARYFSRASEQSGRETECVVSQFAARAVNGMTAVFSSEESVPIG
jgi:hypothetical protein